MQQSHNEEDDQSYDCAHECWDVAIHLPIKLGRAWRVGHLGSLDLAGDNLVDC